MIQKLALEHLPLQQLGDSSSEEHTSELQSHYWRFWNWDPSNDRDFTGLQVLALSQNPARHTQFTQEVRYAGQVTSSLSGVVGLFFIDQEVKVRGNEESGTAQWRFAQSTTSPL